MAISSLRAPSFSSRSRSNASQLTTSTSDVDLRSMASSFRPRSSQSSRDDFKTPPRSTRSQNVVKATPFVEPQRSPPPEKKKKVENWNDFMSSAWKGNKKRSKFWEGGYELIAESCVEEGIEDIEDMRDCQSTKGKEWEDDDDFMIELHRPSSPPKKEKGKERDKREENSTFAGDYSEEGQREKERKEFEKEIAISDFLEEDSSDSEMAMGEHESPPSQEPMGWEDEEEVDERDEDMAMEQFFWYM